MQSRRFSFGNDPAFWRVAFALLLSLALHFFLLGFVNIDITIFETEKDVVEVRFAKLVKPSPPNPPQKVVEAPESSVSQPAVAESSSPLPPPPEPAEFIPVEEPPSVTSAVDEQAQSVPEIPIENAGDNFEDVVAEPKKAEPQTEPQTGPEQTLEPAISEVAEPPLTHVETEFEILRGVDGYKIGKTSIRYISRGDGTYMIHSESEAQGFASIFIPGKLIQRSEGTLTEQGLQPHSFLYQYGKDKTQRATFDWENRKITLETNKNTQTVRLPRDTQDLVSFMYQFMFVPPLQEMQLNITNGKRVKAYSYSFVGEEDLSTKMGIVRVMHLENINDDGDEKNEIWLAVDSRFLPVKIRKTEKDGSVIEQVVTDLKTDILQ